MAEWSVTRRHVRLDTPGTALLSAGRRAVPFAIKNVSAGGILLAGDAPLPVGDAVEVEMQLHETRALLPPTSEHHDSSLQVDAQVSRVAPRHRNHYEVALEFVRPSSETGEIIDELTYGRSERDIIGVRPEVLILMGPDGNNLQRALEYDLAVLGHETFCVSTLLEAVFWLQMPETACNLAIVAFESPCATELLELLINQYPYIHRFVIARRQERRPAEQWYLAGAIDGVLGRQWTLWELAAAL